MTILSNYNGCIDGQRKMQFNSVKRGNFSRLAGHVNKVTDQAFRAARETAVDNTAIAKESMKGRSLERRAAMKAEGEVAQAGLKAATKVKLTDIKLDAAESVRKSKASANRMAGIVGGLGTIIGGAAMLGGDKEGKAEREELKGMRNAMFQKSEQLDAEKDKRDQKVIDLLNNRALPNVAPEAPKTDLSITAPLSSTTSPTTSTKPVASVKSKGSPNFKGFVDMASAAGAKFPQLVAAQWALESGWGKTPSGKNNYFGIKASSGESGTSKQTWEVYDGKEVTTSARFKNFDTPQDGVNELVNKWHKDYKNYTGVNNASDAFSAADMLRQQGYATDPSYSEKLKKIMRDQGY